MKKFYVVLTVVVLVLVGLFFYQNKPGVDTPPPVPPVVDNSDLKDLTVKEGDTISSPFIVEGKAKGNWFFEGSFPVTIYDEDDNVVVAGYAQAQGEWTTPDYVVFKADLNFAKPNSEKGKIVFEKDNPSGLPENSKQVSLNIKFGTSGSDSGQDNVTSDTSVVKLFFPNNKRDPETLDCKNVFPVVRTLDKTPKIATETLKELLKGPTAAEKTQGFYTSINDNVKINNLSIRAKTAYVDFDDRLEFQVGGSCRVASIAAEITETLKQFPSISNVVISVNGRAEDVLQP